MPSLFRDWEQEERKRFSRHRRNPQQRQAYEDEGGGGEEEGGEKPRRRKVRPLAKGARAAPPPHSVTESPGEKFKHGAAEVAHVGEEGFKKLGHGAEETWQVSESGFKKFEHISEEGMEFIAEKTHVPFWGVFAFFMLIFLLILAGCLYCCKKNLNKLKEGANKLSGGKLDLNKVQLLGQGLKDQKVSNYHLINLWSKADCLFTVQCYGYILI